jgi:thioredoxin-like negative regulator of GroEL
MVEVAKFLSHRKNKMKLIKLSMQSCAPCKELSRTLEGVDHPLVKNIEEVSVDRDTTLAKKYAIRSVPALILVDSEGNKVRQLLGAQTKDSILEFLGT